MQSPPVRGDAERRADPAGFEVFGERHATGREHGHGRAGDCPPAESPSRKA